MSDKLEHLRRHLAPDFPVGARFSLRGFDWIEQLQAVNGSVWVEGRDRQRDVTTVTSEDVLEVRDVDWDGDEDPALINLALRDYGTRRDHTKIAFGLVQPGAEAQLEQHIFVFSEREAAYFLRRVPEAPPEPALPLVLHTHRLPDMDFAAAGRAADAQRFGLRALAGDADLQFAVHMEMAATEANAPLLAAVRGRRLRITIDVEPKEEPDDPQQPADNGT